jgi:hypothetical protein
MKAPKGKITTAIVILATFILAGVAIFTAIRLYQLRQQPVAPNVPSSIPRAQEVSTCSLTFTLAERETAVCSSKKAYVAANNTSTITDKKQDFALGSEISSGGNVSPGQEIIYVIGISEGSSGLSYTTTDTLDSKLEYINYQSTDECSFNSTTQALSCNATDSGRLSVQVKIKAKVKATATGSLANVANVTFGSEAPVSCNISLNVSTQTSSPTPGTPGPSATPNACGGTCGSNFNCGSTLVCYNGFCRNPSCTSVANCVCGTSAPATTPPSLPESGTDWPTILGAGVGILVILGSLLLAL